ncbi:PQQ-binding-like beta-propeller repeat protein [Cellulomonas sp. SLBN-39]|uniref:outer membrane protein assembly factor BamB family protein n=1 Tax=Cellulomonas sp. SLBN-39 TaxID=2768446 RepID=UPI0011513C07|nr:PQQ-binding-like beta-propeller repeat protein [Cellulomonas sp. SLBN-39]TQL02170.1 putative pyrroloquinoline-quinone binding quinoprotein [Cellulomonas sp. SLBN-39]
MARTGRVEVELVEDDADGGPGAPGPRPDGEPARATARRAGAAVGSAARGLRRRFRPWWLVPPLVLALALGAAQHVTDARERERLAALAHVPGVLPPLDGPLAPVWTSSPDGDAWPFAVTDEAVLVERYALAGPTSVDALDVATGELLWSAPLPSAVPQTGEGTGWTGSGCAPPNGGSLVCFTSSWWDPHGAAPGGPAAVGRVDAVVVDLTTGATDVGLTMLVDPPTSATVAGDAVVVVGLDEHRSPVVRAVDVRGGQELWRTVLDARLPEDLRSPWLPAVMRPVVPGVVVLDLGDPLGVVLLDADSGRVLDEVGGATVPWLSGREDRLILDTGGRTLIWSPAASADVAGSPLMSPVDDGTFGDVIPVLDGEDIVLAGPDGTERVRVGTAGGDVVLLMDGRLVVADGSRTAAVDGDGELVWEHRGTGPSDVSPTLLTDGSVVVRQTGDTSVHLKAFDVHDGRPAWSTTLPGVVDLVLVDGRLLGMTSDGGVALLR